MRSATKGILLHNLCVVLNYARDISWRMAACISFMHPYKPSGRCQDVFDTMKLLVQVFLKMNTW